MDASSTIFRFKKFKVVNRRSAMKVNTDGVLLGAVMTIDKDDKRLLDIGTGTGTIALMAAQRLFEAAHEGAGEIDAIDIDQPSAEEAAQNFAASPWPSMLRAYHMGLDAFAAHLSAEDQQGRQKQYDLIFSNPPYFDNALEAPEQRRNTARHTTPGLSYREIIEFSAQHLTPKGRLALVLPSDTETELTRYARMNGLFLFSITRVRTVPRKAPSRIIAEFSRARVESPQDRMLTIQDGGTYTQEYLETMKDYYLFA